MHSFKDSEGRSWEVRVDVTGVKAVRQALDINLLDLPSDDFKLGERLCSDPILLVDVLWVLCRKQAQGRGIDDETFGRSMAGDAILQATTALLDEVVDFFPDARRRQALGKVLAKGRQLGDLMLDRATAKVGDLEKLDLEALADAAIAQASRLRQANPSVSVPTDAAGSSPASPA